MPIGNPAFGPTGLPGGSPDARGLLRAAGELALAPVGYPGAVLLTGEAGTANTDTGTAIQGYLYLTRVPVVGPHLVAVGLDPGLSLGVSGVHVGLYRAIRGVPAELLLDCGMIDDTDATAEHCFADIDFAAPESVEVFVGWVWASGAGDATPTALIANTSSVVGAMAVPGQVDPTAALRSWNPSAGDPASSWQQSLADWNPFGNGYAAQDGGFVHYPRRGAGRYGVTGALPETLPSEFGIFLDGIDGIYYGFGPDGGWSSSIQNLRAVVKLADA